MAPINQKIGQIRMKFGGAVVTATEPILGYLAAALGLSMRNERFQLAVMNGTDVSIPAFWLPFQDLTTNNHLAQWAQRSFNGTCKMDGDCNMNGMKGRCCVNGGCTACITAIAPTIARRRCASTRSRRSSRSVCNSPS